MHGYQKLVGGLAFLAVLLLTQQFLEYVRSFLLLKQSKDFNLRILDYFFNALIKLPKSFFDNRKTGDLVARMNDTGRIQKTVAYLWSKVAIDFLMFIASMIVIMSYSWVIVLITLSCIPIIFFISYRFHSPILKGQKSVMQAHSKNESNYIDSIQGINEIKINNKEAFFGQKTYDIFSVFQQSIFNLGQVGINFGLYTQLASTVFVIVILTSSAFLVFENALTIGGLMAILQLVGIASGAATRLAMTNLRIQGAKVAFNRMFEFSSLQPEESKDNPEQQEINFETLEIKNLSFRFRGRRSLLQNISLEMKKGEIISILGESGSGKSTLMQILQKFYHPENGSIMVNGNNLENLDTYSWRQLLGNIPQSIKIFNSTLIDNILLGETLETPEQLDYTESFFNEYGFDTYFSKFPNGYLTLLGENGINLSGGQRQLVALARALYRKPQILIMDEATTAMDRKIKDFTIHLLHKLKSEMGIIICTHQIEVARHADRIYIIEHKCIQDSGSHESLLKKDNLYSASWAEMMKLY